MNIESIRKEIREKLKTAHNHIDIYNVNEPYKNMLEQEINSNPKNIAAYCLLAMVIESMINCGEDRMDTLEKCYELNKGTFSDDEYDGESKSISKKITKYSTTLDIAIIISKVFSSSFDEPFTVEDSLIVAKNI